MPRMLLMVWLTIVLCGAASAVSSRRDTGAPRNAPTASLVDKSTRDHNPLPAARAAAATGACSPAITWAVGPHVSTRRSGDPTHVAEFTSGGSDAGAYLIVAALDPGTELQTITLLAESSTESLAAPLTSAPPRNPEARRGGDRTDDLDEQQARSTSPSHVTHEKSRARAEISSPPSTRSPASSTSSNTSPMTTVRGGVSEPNGSRAFWLHVHDLPLEDARGSVRLTTDVVHAGRRVTVRRDAQVADSVALRERARHIVAWLEERVIPEVDDWLGSARDVDGDGTLTVVLTPWLGRLQGGRTTVRGLVRGADFDRRLALPFGNSADVLFVHSDLPWNESLRAVLAHEYTHVVTLGARSSADDCELSEEDWVSEGVAHVVEDRMRTGDTTLTDRVRAFRQNPGAAPLVVSDYFRAGLWRDPGCRGATFSFHAWCVRTFGDELLHRLVRPPRPLPERNQVDAAPTLQAIGRRNFEQATGMAFDDLLLRWVIDERLAHVRNGSDAAEVVHTWNLRDPLPVTLRGTAAVIIRLAPATTATRCEYRIRCQSDSPTPRLAYRLATSNAP